RVGQLIHLEHAVLEQVTAAFVGAVEQPHRVLGLDVLREHEHAHAWPASTDLLRGDQALVGLRRRHPDVDDGDVGRVLLDARYQLVGGSRGRDDLEPVVGQETGDPLAQQQRVVRDHYAHGISACTRVPCPGGLSTVSRPSSACTRSSRPRRPDPRAGSAPPTPSSSTSTTTSPFARATLTMTRSARAYFATLVSDSETRK